MLLYSSVSLYGVLTRILWCGLDTFVLQPGLVVCIVAKKVIKTKTVLQWLLFHTDIYYICGYINISSCSWKFQIRFYTDYLTFRTATHFTSCQCNINILRVAWDRQPWNIINISSPSNALSLLGHSCRLWAPKLSLWPKNDLFHSCISVSQYPCLLVVYLLGLFLWEHCLKMHCTV